MKKGPEYQYFKQYKTKFLQYMIEEPQKGKDSHVFVNRIQFNLTRDDLECFISKQPKMKSNHKTIPKTNSHAKPQIKVIGEHSELRPRDSPYLDLCFDHKLLFTKYGPLDLFVDEKPSNSSAAQTSQYFDEEDLESSQVVSQCLRAISDDTSDSLNTEYSSVQAVKYYNQQIIDMGRSRSKLGNEESVFSIRPVQAEFDGRTTLMLRNIPNKYTQEMVLQEVEAAGLELKYDFFYLPIDFKNDCNVGYAFINLVDVRFVQKLYEKFHGKKWPKFNSEKICQVCYARIQGTPQLLNHFRFSNTLQRDNRCRPLIYLNLNLNASDQKTRESPERTEKPFGCFTI